MPFEEVARLAGEWGYDGLEIACWGDHFDPWAAVEDPTYIQTRHDILEKNGLKVYAISNHLTGQATHAALEAIGHREAFGLNWDPSHFVWQDLDPLGFLWYFRDRIYHVDCKDAKKQVGNGRNGRLGSHLPWADPRRGWDFVSTGRGDVPWEACFRMLNTIGYGPISIEWEDAGMDRLLGAPEALAFVKANLFDAPEAAFDAAFSSGD